MQVPKLRGATPTDGGNLLYLISAFGPATMPRCSVREVLSARGLCARHEATEVGASTSTSPQQLGKCDSLRTGFPPPTHVGR